MNFRRLKKFFAILGSTSPLVLLRYLFSRLHTIEARIYGEPLLLRPRTTDIKVAVDSFGGEFLPLAEFGDPKQVKTVVDAGGYVGTAAIALSKIYTNAQILSVEASTANFKVLAQNTREHKRIIAINAALASDSNMELTLLNRGTGEWGFTAMKADYDLGDASGIEKVAGVTLSELIDKYGKIDVLKIDIEGGEYSIFAEDAKSVAKIPIIFAELHDRVVTGCRSAFESIPGPREITAAGGEKYLSVNHELLNQTIE